LNVNRLQEGSNDFVEDTVMYERVEGRALILLFFVSVDHTRLVHKHTV